MAIVGEPLTPTVLAKLGALANWPPPAEPFNPDGNWVHTYRIWTCHGYTDRRNDNQGVLRVERVAGTGSESFRLNIRQVVIHTTGIAHKLSARIRCRNDRLASPEDWSLTSRFYDPNGRQRNDLTLRRQGWYRDGRVASTINGKPHEIIVSRQMTADWCLFDVLQRWTLGKSQEPVFDVLEGLSVLRPNQRVSFDGQERRIRHNGPPFRVRRFCQLGRGVLPYEYWLDNDNRLLLAITGSRAYILDPQAEAEIRRRRQDRSRKG